MKWRACRRHRGFHSNLDRVFPMPLGDASCRAGSACCGQVDLAGGERHWAAGSHAMLFSAFFAVAAVAAGGCADDGDAKHAPGDWAGWEPWPARHHRILLPLTLGRNSTRSPAAAAPSWSSALRLAGGGAPSQKPRPRSPCKDTDAAKPKPKERGGGGRSAGPICCCACRLELCVRVWIEGGRRSSSGAASSWGTRLAGLGSVQGFGEGVLRAGRVGGG
mmetsp:Transcript_89342/g.238927  ORF Transcript_89342/g.238927 Transcript_89342/m.238927 type:complete len:219 (+) Transcript_89342:842-1498(+)